VVGTPIQTKGKMFVRLNGAQIYSKGGFNATNPQPTPEEADELVRTITEAAGTAKPLSERELADFRALHAAQIAKGKSKH